MLGEISTKSSSILIWGYNGNSKIWIWVERNGFSSFASFRITYTQIDMFRKTFLLGAWWDPETSRPVKNHTEQSLLKLWFRYKIVSCITKDLISVTFAMVENRENIFGFTFIICFLLQFIINFWFCYILFSYRTFYCWCRSISFLDVFYLLAMYIIHIHLSIVIDNGTIPINIQS